MLKRDTSIWLFLGFLLLGGVAHSVDVDSSLLLETVFTCAEYLIYAGLILFWTQSLNERLLPTRSKRYLLAAACLMLVFLAAQFTKYRIAVTPGMTRYCWYVYYLPMLLIPTLFLMACFRLVQNERAGKPDELLFLIPAGLLALGVLTNDLHMLAFVPNEDMASLIGSPNTYTHGWLYYAAYAWIGCSMVAGIIFLLIACKKSGRWKKALPPLIFLALMPPLFAICGMVPKDSLPITYEWPEVFIFGMLFVFEACIRSRLIPSNENHPGFFAQMELPILITDNELNAVFQTQSPVRATDEEMRSSLDEPVYLTPDTRLSGMALRGGLAFWTEDESTVNRLNEELQDANDVLALENEILAREQELAAEKAGIEERSRLYQRAAHEVHPAQKKIAEILKEAEPGTDSFRPDIAKALVLMAHVKRKANFVLVEAERETVSAKELAAALEESAHYLRCCGMDAAVDVTAGRAFPCREAMAIYDCFEAVAEALLGNAEELFVRLHDDGLLMMADGEGPMELPEPAGSPISVRQSFADGQLIWRATVGGETV